MKNYLFLIFCCLTFVQDDLYAQFVEGNGADCVQYSECFDFRFVNNNGITAIYDINGNLLPLNYPYNAATFSNLFNDIAALYGGSGAQDFTTAPGGGLCGIVNTNLNEFQFYDLGIQLGYLELGNGDVLNFMEFGNCTCEYTADNATTEECGEFTIELTNIMEDGYATGTYDVLVNGAAVLTGVAGAIQTLGPFPADGTTVYNVDIHESGDPTCILNLMITAPASSPLPMLTVTCPGPIDICAGTTTPLNLGDSSGGAMAVYGGTCTTYVNTNGTTSDVTDDFIDPAGAQAGSCMLTIQLVDANGCDSGTPEVCTILFERSCDDADGGEFPSTGP